jgi:AraC family transcriptional regulator
MHPTIVYLKEKKIIGYSCKMNFIKNKTSNLWKSFMPRLKEIKNKISADLYSVQVYDADYNFKQFDPSIEFIKWATTQVSAFDKVSANMESLIISAGLYAVFLHKGSNADNSKHQYIFQKWLPASDWYVLDARPHFEVLGESYKNGDTSSEEEIWIPIKLNI